MTIQNLADAKMAIESRITGVRNTDQPLWVVNTMVGELEIALGYLEQTQMEILRRINEEIQTREVELVKCKSTLIRRRIRAELRVWKEARKLFTGESKYNSVDLTITESTNRIITGETK